MLKRLGVVLAIILLLVLLGSTVDWWRSRSLMTRALKVKTGDSRTQVEGLMGKPTWTFSPLPEASTNLADWLLSVRSETWAYGRRFDLGLLFHGEMPFTFRLFSPGSNDVSVIFDSSGRVSQVTIPGVSH